MNAIRRFLLRGDRDREIEELQRKLMECEYKIDKMLDVIDNLVKFDERFSEELTIVASHLALIEMSMTRGRKTQGVRQKRESNDDDLVN